MKHLDNLIFATGFIALATVGYLYGETLFENRVSVSEVPTHFICEFDPIFDQYICYEEQS